MCRDQSRRSSELVVSGSRMGHLPRDNLLVRRAPTNLQKTVVGIQQKWTTDTQGGVPPAIWQYSGNRGNFWKQISQFYSRASKIARASYSWSLRLLLLHLTKQTAHVAGVFLAFTVSFSTLQNETPASWVRQRNNQRQREGAAHRLLWMLWPTTWSWPLFSGLQLRTGSSNQFQVALNGILF